MAFQKTNDSIPDENTKKHLTRSEILSNLKDDNFLIDLTTVLKKDNILMLDDVEDSFIVLGRNVISSIKSHNSSLSQSEEENFLQSDDVEQTSESPNIVSSSSDSKWQYLKSDVTEQYINEVKLAVADHPEIFNEFFNIMMEFDKKHIDEYHFIKMVTSILRDYHELLYGLNTILPFGRIADLMPDQNGHISCIKYKASDSLMKYILITDRTTSNTSSTHNLSAETEPVVSKYQNESLTFPKSSTTCNCQTDFPSYRYRHISSNMKQINHTSKNTDCLGNYSGHSQWRYLKSVDIDQYVNEVKLAFINCPKSFEEFLKIVIEFDKQNIHEYNFVKKIINILKNYPKLIIRLNKFLSLGNIISIVTYEDGQTSYVTYETPEPSTTHILITNRTSPISSNTPDHSNKIKSETSNYQNETMASSSPLPTDKDFTNCCCRNQPINSNLEQNRESFFAVVQQNDIEKKLNDALEENTRLKEAIEKNTAFMKQNFDKMEEWQNEIKKICNEKKKQYHEIQDLLIQLKQENKLLRKSISSKTAMDVNTQTANNVGMDKRDCEILYLSSINESLKHKLELLEKKEIERSTQECEKSKRVVQLHALRTKIQNILSHNNE